MNDATPSPFPPRCPKPLAAGDLIAITAPSSGVQPSRHARLDRALDALRRHGYRVLEGDCLRAEQQQASAPAAQRAAELMRFLCDPEVAAVMPPATEPVFNARTDFQAAVEATKVTLSELMDYGTRFKGASSYLQASGAAALASATSTITSADYGYTMDELQALFDSVNAENQVKRLQVQSVQNARMAVLEGMSNFMSGQLLTNQTVERNL